jgi:TRIAD3 protein (E3 ubiquitin-protein ligase RNF216)
MSALIPSSFILPKPTRRPQPSRVMLECSCCCETKSKSLFASCTNGHRTCQTCVSQYVKNQLYQACTTQFNCIDCKSGGCNGIYTENDVFSFVNEAYIYSVYKNIKTEEEIRSLCVDGINIKLCYYCGDGVDIGDSEQESLFCVKCLHTTCLLCGMEEHPGKPCETADYYKETEDKTNDLVIKCTKCYRNIFKTEGCNKLTCVCRAIYCAICKNRIKGYDHFKNSNASCNLYNL